MNIKKISSIIISTIFIATLVGCSSSKDNKESIDDVVSNQEEIIEEAEPEITSFESFGKTYSSTKDLSQVEKSTDIYDDQVSNSYVHGEYKELDLANDILYAYVNQNQDVYNYLVSFDESSETGIVPITEEDKIKLQENLASLRGQMELSDGEEMIIKLDKVTYQGVSSKTNSGASFKIRVAISAVGDYSAAWNYHTVEVFEDGNKLVANLF